MIISFMARSGRLRVNTKQLPVFSGAVLIARTRSCYLGNRVSKLFWCAGNFGACNLLELVNG